MDNIKATLLHYTPKEVIIEAMSMPYKTDNFRSLPTEQAMKKIKAICVDKKHGSVLEHISFNFKIEGISRLCLQELVRHRMASYTVESTRYTLPSKEEWNNIHSIALDLVGGSDEDKDKYNELATKYIVIPNNLSKYDGHKHTSQLSFMLLVTLSELVIDLGFSNDKLKYFLPESWRTNLVISINARSLRNFLQLRLSPQAHFEIRHLAGLIYEQIPAEYKVLFEDLGGNND